MNATKAVNDYADKLIRDWLLKPVVIQVEEGEEVVEKTIPNLAFLKNRALIKEMIAYNPHINVDRVRALGMVMLYRGQFLDMFEGDLSRAGQEDFTVEDDYFKQYDEMKAAYEKC